MPSTRGRSSKVVVLISVIHGLQNEGLFPQVQTTSGLTDFSSAPDMRVSRRITARRQSRRLLDQERLRQLPSLMPASLMTFAHSGISLPMTAANSAGVLPTGSRPSSSNFLRTSGVARALAVSP